MSQKKTPQDVIKNIRHSDKAVLIELKGDIDMSRAMELRGGLLEILQGKPATLVVIMNEVEFMDSSGLATLVEGLQVSRKRGSEFKLVGLQSRVRSIFEISRLDKIFQIYENETEALKA